MWNRKDLKTRGKAAFKANYWLCVVVALIHLVIFGGLGAAASSSGINLNYNFGGNTTPSFNFPLEDTDPFGGAFSIEGEPTEEDFARIQEDINASLNDLMGSVPDPAFLGLSAVALGVLITAVVVAFIAGSLFDILLLNPLDVSCRNFFLCNSQGRGELNNLDRGFRPSWSNVVKTMFIRDLFLLLWGLLLVIPGIVKSYAYRMVPYILADHPEIGGTRAITLSRQMMRGQKWRAFVLDLSFIGWYILSAFTLGILAIFYVRPYQLATDAELYQALKQEVNL